MIDAPFEHVAVENFLPADIYEQARASFPVCDPRGGPTGHSAFWGETDFDELVTTNPAWSALFNTFQSQAFVAYCIEQFGDVFRRHGCVVDLDKARYVPWVETREAKRTRRLDGARPQENELWVRMDMLQGRISYNLAPHLDHRRRLISMLIYMCDADEIGMRGGDLLLYGGDASGPAAEPQARIRPRHNLMVAFPCTPNSWHSVSRIKAGTADRNFIQVALSSSDDAWAA